MISVENILERTCGELPRSPFLSWAAVLFTLFVLTLQISLAASQAFLAGAGILYVIHLWQARPRVLFLPVKLPLALFCVLSVVSIFWAANPRAGWFAVQKLVLFLIWLLAINLVVSAEHLRRLLQGLFLVSFLTSLVASRNSLSSTATCGRIIPASFTIPDVNAHPWVYGTLDELRWTADAGFRLSVGISAALRAAETRKSKLETRRSWARISSFDFEFRFFGGRCSPSSLFRLF